MPRLFSRTHRSTTVHSSAGSVYFNDDGYADVTGDVAVHFAQLPEFSYELYEDSKDLATNMITAVEGMKIEDAPSFSNFLKKSATKQKELLDQGGDELADDVLKTIGESKDFGISVRRVALRVLAGRSKR